MGERLTLSDRAPPRLLRRARGLAWSVVLGSMLVGVATAAAQAQEAEACASLRARLVTLDRQGSTEASQWGAAIQQQREALARGQAQADRYCSANLFGGPSSSCDAIQKRNIEMQRNLAGLEKKYQRMGAAGPRAERLNVLASLKAYGCNGGRPGDAQGTVSARWGGNGGAPPGLTAGGPPSQAVPPSRLVAGARDHGDGRKTFVLQGPNGPMVYREDNGRLTPIGPAVASTAPAQGEGLFGALFGPSRPAQSMATVGPAEETDPNGLPEGELPSEGGAYRTLCVRTCDGYYFPISYATSRARFATDASVCRAMCPGTETRLFVHRNPGEDSDQAISADGEGIPYTRLPNAMRYRTQKVEGCTCGRADPTLLPLGIDADPTARRRSVEVGDVRPDLPVPRAKPRPDDDPDTAWNAAADFTPAPIEPLAPAAPVAETGGSAPAAPATPGERKVRIVGPKYFAGQ